MNRLSANELAPRVPVVLRGAGAHRRAVGQPHPARPRPAVHRGRDGAVQAVLPRRGGAAVPPGHDGAEVPAGRGQGQRPRGGRARRQPPELLRDARQLQLRRLLQGRGHPHGLGPHHQPVRARPRPAVGHGAHHRRRGREHLARRRRRRPRPHPAPRRRTTGGVRPVAHPARAGRARRSSSTRARPTATTAARPTAPTTGSSRSGTSCSCSSTGTPTRSTTSCPARTSTPAPASSASSASSRASTRCGRSTPSPRILETAQSVAGVRLGADDRHDVSLRILAEHARAVSFLVSDGVFPSNEGRGYVLRRIIRRLVRHAYLLGVEHLATPELVRSTVEVMGESYPDLVTNQGFVTDVVVREEERFRQTLKQGLNILDIVAGRPGRRRRRCRARWPSLLHDTHGFPLELTEEITSEQGIGVDRAGFDEAMADAAAHGQGRPQVRRRRRRRPVLRRRPRPVRAHRVHRSGREREQGPGPRGHRRGRAGGHRARPHAVLRRERRPGRRPRHAAHRDRHRRRCSTPPTPCPASSSATSPP